MTQETRSIIVFWPGSKTQQSTILYTEKYLFKVVLVYKQHEAAFSYYAACIWNKLSFRLRPKMLSLNSVFYMLIWALKLALFLF